MTYNPSFRVEVRTIDGSIGTIDREGGDYAFAQTAAVDPRLFADLREANAERERITARLAGCWNAMHGIPDPAAFVQAARGMREALEFYSDLPVEWVIVHEGTALRQGDCRLLGEKARIALSAFRAAMGEGQSDD